MKSNFFSIPTWEEVGKSLLYAFITAFVASFGQFLEGWANGSADVAMAKISFILSLKAGVGAMLAVLMTTIVSNSKGKFLSKEPNGVPLVNNGVDTDIPTTTEPQKP